MYFPIYCNRPVVEKGKVMATTTTTTTTTLLAPLINLNLQNRQE